ncbi:TPR-like protein [Trametes polyzona]|nr:TPR-like protein [Trametes polyzona]
MPPPTSLRLATAQPPGPPPSAPSADPPPPPQPAPGAHTTLSTSLARDAMMAYAYYLYDSPGPGRTPLGLTSVPVLHVPPDNEPPDRVYRERLLPLLLALREFHPNHIPILLLLACTYYALGDLHTSLSISQHILSLNANYVEAMSNIGTTMKALGQTDKAYEWWWKALQIRPTYWDALDNILGMTFTLAQNSSNNTGRLAYYRQALGVCQYVQRHVLNADGRLVVTLQPNEVPRLQRAIFTSGTIYATLGPPYLERAILDYARAIELVLRPPAPTPEGEQYTFRDLLLAACAAAHIMCSDSSSSGVPEISGVFESDFSARLGDPTFDFLYVVRASGEQLLHALIRAGGGVLPTPLLLPEQVSRLPVLLFPRSNGVLPSICTRSSTGELRPPSENVRQQTNGLLSTILLTLAKRFQDNVMGGMIVPDTGGTLRVSTSVVILLYYLALAWSPAPSTYNNLGIVLSRITDGRTGADGELLDGVGLARMYYTAGLQMDPKHPHLLTNLGSLLKDQGQTEKAIKLYMKAVDQKPDFDIALANLGNAIKDVGRPWDAVQYYRRATRVNPTLPEAVCGLVNSLCSICDWRGRGAMPNEVGVDDAGLFIPPGPHPQTGWVTNMASVTDTQIAEGYAASIGTPALQAVMEECIRALAAAYGRALTTAELAKWHARFRRLARGEDGGDAERAQKERVNEAGFLIRFIDWVQPRLQRQWYIKAYGKTLSVDKAVPTSEENYHAFFARPTLPKTLQPPSVPSVLPFHTFTYPLSPRVTRLIPHRSALRISYTAFAQPWLPKHVYRPPRPPIKGKLNIGYISNDVNNHPLSHLMQSVFGMHDRSRFNVFLYTTSPWDGTAYRPRIASMVEHCVDVSSWSLNTIIDHIMQHEIHILINLGGYTKGARNDIFAARPCPIQMQLMGYAGTLGAGWCDYLVCDPIACPQDTSATERWRKMQATQANEAASRTPPEVSLDLDADLDPESDSDEWQYMEKFIYMPQHTFMVTDHKQSFRGDEDLSPEERAQVPAETLWLDEERRRVDARKQVFPDLPQDVIIFANFNQGIFLVWLRILRQVPRSVLWLLRFPGAGEEHLRRTAKLWAGEDVASRIRFTDVAKKDWHVFRARVADLFLDTAEARCHVQCNAHTIAADVLWTGTPILTWPKHKHKMCSRVAASMANATGFGAQMTVHSAEEYERRAVALAQSVHYVPFHEPSGAVLPRGQGELVRLRRNLFLNRDRMPLFDTLRWTRNFEKGLREAWRRWVEGTQYELSDEWEAAGADVPEKRSGCIWIRDDDPVDITMHTD